MNCYGKICEHLAAGRGVILVSEDRGQGMIHSVYSAFDEQLPETAAAAWEKKAFVWEEVSNGWRKAEPFLPPARLVLLGGGHISAAVAKIAELLELPVTVVDDRPDFANPGRFPGARVICNDFGQALSGLDLDASSLVLVATRGHRYDRECLTILLGKQPAYLGMVSSRRRMRVLRKELLAQGFAESAVDMIHAPAGLDIKAKTPAEIAVSILAEIIAAKRGIFPNEIADQAVLEAARAVEESKGRAVMATIISRKGSTPRKEGARMLILPDGKVEGTIGGGCGEAEVKRAAFQVLDSGRSEIYHLNLTADAAAEEGMACGGIMQVLLEPVGEWS